MEEKISIKRENVLTAYEHASEEQKALLENMFGKEMFQPKEIFTELKEGDERIRRWIIDDIRYNINNEPLNNSEYKKKAEKAIAWLEKQRETSQILSNSSNTGKNEQKSADKIEQRFDPKTLMAFDKVLVRLTKDCIWNVTFFSHYDKEVNWGCYPCVTTSCKSYDKCIPYNDETKHLLGTSDEAPEYYRYWED